MSRLPSPLYQQKLEDWHIEATQAGIERGLQAVARAAAGLRDRKAKWEAEQGYEDRKV